jgi:hypothetical protein
VTDKGLSGADVEDFLAGPDIGLALIRPARKDESQPRYFPNWLRQRVEAVIWTLKNQLSHERHGGRVPAGLRARILQRLLALNACIWHHWLIGAGQALPDRLRPRVNCPHSPVNDLGVGEPTGAVSAR